LATLTLFGEKTVCSRKHRSSYTTTGFSIRTLLHEVIMNWKVYGSLILYIPHHLPGRTEENYKKLVGIVGLQATQMLTT
jgi:hypothetical protein